MFILKSSQVNGEFVRIGLDTSDREIKSYFGGFVLLVSVARRGLSSERIARRILDSLGYMITGIRVPVIVEGTKVAEIDLMAVDPDGEKYAVEVKAGKAGVSDIRQAYTNALMVNAKPMIICKGFADEAARQAAKTLGVEVLNVSSYYHIVDMDELYAVVNEAVREVLEEYGLFPLPPREALSRRDIEVLKALADSSDPVEAAEKLGIKLRTFNHRVKKLKLRGVLPRVRNYERLKLVADNILRRMTLEELEDRLTKSLEKMDKVLNKMERLLSKLVEERERKV